MFRKRSSTVLLGLLLCAASAAAQVNVTLQLPSAQMPAGVAVWREDMSLTRIVVQNTGHQWYRGLVLSMELSKDGQRIARSRDGHPAQPRFSLKPGETRSLSWREVISEEAVEYDGSIGQQVAATGELPEGQYLLCVQVLSVQLRPISPQGPISPQACGSFEIVLPDPPVLVSPIGGAQASVMPLLEWAPSSNAPALGLQYLVTVKVRYRGQTPEQAMANNPVRLQVTVPTTSYQVPVTEQLGDDVKDPNYAGHVWQVQALLNGRPYGRNSGLSQIEWFVVREADPPVLVWPTGGWVSPTPVLQWRPSDPPVPGLQYQVTVKVRYLWQTTSQAMASNPVRLQATVSTTSYEVPGTAHLWSDAKERYYVWHVWQVQALLNGRPYGRNNGLSEIGVFVVSVPIPPMLVSPINGERVSSSTPLLQWRPSDPPVPGLQYQVTVKVRYIGQTLEEAMASNPVRLQVTVPTTSYQVTSPRLLGADAAHQLYAGHVWQVQALLNGRPYGRNNGLSFIGWFWVRPWRPPPPGPPRPSLRVIEPPRPTDEPPIGIGRSIRVLMWEVPYEEIRPGRPIKLQVPPIQEDTVLYVLRVRVPEKLSLQQLEQLRKNWAHEVRKEISAERTHQDTFVVQSYPPKYATVYRVGQDTFGVQRRYFWEPILTPVRIWGIEQDTAGAGMARWYGRYISTFRVGQDTFGVQYYAGGYYLFGTPQDTAGAGVDRTRYTGGYFLYALPQDTTKPAELVDYYVPNGTPQDTTEPASAARINIKPLADRVVVEPAPAEERQIAYNAGVEGAIIVERRGNVLVVGNFTPTHVALPMPELELDPGEGPVCGIPEPLRQGEETVGSTARYTGYVLNQAIATGPKPSGKTLGAVTRQAPPQGGNQNMAGPISLPRPSDVGIPEFRMMPPGGGAPVLWPNGNPPHDPDWPWVGVIGTPVLEGIDGAPGPGKPQNWCGTEYIWTGPPPKSPKELILTLVIPRPR